ncbi:MAG: SRPBCC domain-containing protein [Lacisediminihabitans sp.]
MDGDQSRPGDSDLVVIEESSASVSAVWRSLAEEHTEWWPDLQFEAVRGAPLREDWTEDGVEHQAMGHVVEVQVGKLLTFHWSEPRRSAPLCVRFELESIATGTRLSVVEFGFDRIPNGHELFAAHREGWKYHPARLRSHAER